MEKSTITTSPEPKANMVLVAVPFTHLGLFEGIGGFSLAARWMGWETKAWCEWNEFGQRILKHHFPNAEGFGDITKTDFTKYANKIDILTGGFPCQPFSSAGKNKGINDIRFLWPETLRAIREIKPRFIVCENVIGIKNVVLDRMRIELENIGYKTENFIIPACSVGSKHRRDRVWVIGYFDNITNRTLQSISERQENKFGRIRRNEEWSPLSVIRTGIYGLPKELDSRAVRKWESNTLKAAANAIVPQVAYEIFKSVESVHWHSH